MLAILSEYSNLIFAAISGVLGMFIWFQARREGSEVEKRKQAIESLKKVNTSAKIENDVISANDTEYNRLYDKWRKP